MHCQNKNLISTTSRRQQNLDEGTGGMQEDYENIEQLNIEIDNGSLNQEVLDTNQDEPEET